MCNVFKLPFPGLVSYGKEIYLNKAYIFSKPTAYRDEDKAGTHSKCITKVRTIYLVSCVEPRLKLHV